MTADRRRWVRRADRGELLPAVRRDDGTLLLEGYACREGILEYPQEDGTIWREYVPAKTLRDSAGGLAWAPVTLEHPEDDVTPENAKDLSVGSTGEESVFVQEGGFVRVRMVVRRGDAVEAVEAGKHELSPGYIAHIDETPGVNKYGRYDAVQIGRKYNHLALVDEARGGDAIRVRMDGTRTSTTLIRADQAPQQGDPMNPLLVALAMRVGVKNPETLGTDSALIPAIAGRVDSMQQDMDKMQSDMEGMEPKTDMEELQGKYDALVAERDELKTMLDSLLARHESEEIKPLADMAGVEIEKSDSVDDVRRKIAAKYLGQDMSQATPTYVRAVCDSLSVQMRRSAAQQQSTSPVGWSFARHDGADPAPPSGPSRRGGLSTISAAQSDAARGEG